MTSISKNKFFSFAAPWFADGAMALVQTAMPLLALGFGANSAELGRIGALGQMCRFPLTHVSGNLSEKVGRVKIMVPALLLIALAAGAMVFAHSTRDILICYAIIMGSFGIFYPPLQAFIGDMSGPKYLRKNLGAYNIGWCAGGAVAGLIGGWLVRFGLNLPLYAAVGCGIMAAIMVIVWKKTCSPDESANVESITESDPSQSATIASPSCPPYLLFVARMGCVTGVFGIAVARVLFPAFGKGNLHWSDSQIALVTSMALVGQAVAVLSTYISAWWRGRTWPQVALQLVILFSGILVIFTKSPIVLGLAFFLIGFAQGVAYTAALYHGISGGTSRGKAGGIHESLMAGGHIIGNIFGGIAAQNISPTAPYFILSIMAGLCLLVTVSLAYYYRKK